MSALDWLLRKKHTIFFNRTIELLLPPVLVDRKIVACVCNLLQGKGFRYYEATVDPVAIPRCRRRTDCTSTIIRKAKGLIVGNKVLDIGCGPGEFIKDLARLGFECTGVDPNQDAERGEAWQILSGFVEDQGFEEKYFETVVSFKTLEHIIDARSTLQSWRRLASQRVILILPCQRYRRYTYDGHVNFYPDEFQLRTQLGLRGDAKVEMIDHEWLVYENVEKIAGNRCW